MKLNTSRKLCPICDNENDEYASICIHCGAWLEENPTKLVTVPEKSKRSADASAMQTESLIDIESIPEGGIGIHVAGETKPLYVPVSKEVVIGRKTETASPPEDFLDLTNMHAATMGVSRRHVLIRRSASGFEIIDLLSRNGTWLNAERLVPNKSYPLASGSQLRIGNMRLIIMYRAAKKS